MNLIGNVSKLICLHQINLMQYLRFVTIEQEVIG